VTRGRNKKNRVGRTIDLSERPFYDSKIVWFSLIDRDFQGHEHVGADQRRRGQSSEPQHRLETTAVEKDQRLLPTYVVAVCVWEAQIDPSI
jgi:hypothetical protein